jgi:N-acetylglutamate synthase-like GNAT family acetyltransferase
MRRAGPQDAAAIAALTREAYAKWVGVIGREPLPMQVDYAQALTRHRFDVLESDGEIVGVIETAPDEDHLLIVNLAVSPKRQAQGCGARLLDRAQAIAAEAGLRGLRLYTNRRFAENIAFYARRGFAAEREAPLNGGVVVYMAKPLA